MFVWDWLGGDTAVGEVVPEAYAEYRRPVTAALRFFVENLPGPRAFTILVEQMELDPSAGVAERLTTLARACPVLHKLGQVLARDRRLDLELRKQLQRLESMEPRVSIPELRALIEQDLGPLERMGLVLEPVALAEASVAVVVPFQYPTGDGDRLGPGRGVFKVLKPGIEERLNEELALLEDVGTYLDERCAEFGIPALDYREVFAQVRAILSEEVRLDGEQRHLAAARAAFEGWESSVLVPRLLRWSSPRITAMERIEGRKVTEHGTSSPEDRGRLARRIIVALIVQPICSTAPAALFHGDPHAGNLFVTPDGRLALLDWSLVGQLGDRERETIVQILLGALTLDERPILDALRALALADRVVDEPALECVVAGHLRRVRQGELPGFRWLTGLLDEAVQGAGLRVGTDLLLFRKVLLTLEGVVADVSAGLGLDLDAVLMVSMLNRLVGELPFRTFAPLNSRSFGTRLSNADLMRLALALPWTTARIGLDWWQELLASRGIGPNPTGST